MRLSKNELWWGPRWKGEGQGAHPNAELASLQRAVHHLATWMLKAVVACRASMVGIDVHDVMMDRPGTMRLLQRSLDCHILERRLANLFCQIPDGKYCCFPSNMLSLSHCVSSRQHHTPPSLPLLHPYSF